MIMFISLSYIGNRSLIIQGCKQMQRLAHAVSVPKVGGCGRDHQLRACEAPALPTKPKAHNAHLPISIGLPRRRGRGEPFWWGYNLLRTPGGARQRIQRGW